jgi:hypothetical protein
MTRTVVSLFDLTGVMVKPWSDAGYDCHIFDIQHKDGGLLHGNIHTHKIDLMRQQPIDIKIRMPGISIDEIKFVSCFPPCTHLSVSGARWFKGKGLRKLAESIVMFATAAEFCERIGAPYIIENPVSTISTYWRKPDYTFHPWEYNGYNEGDGDDNYTKRTCLWTGNGFIMPPKWHDLDGEPDQRIWNAPGSGQDRANFRSKTPAGFAKAVFMANTVP